MLELTLGCRTDGRAITTAGRENPHIFADGISGAGKSFELKRLAEDAVCQGAQVIAFDYRGESLRRNLYWTCVSNDVALVEVNVMLDTPIFILAPEDGVGQPAARQAYPQLLRQRDT